MNVVRSFVLGAVAALSSVANAVIVDGNFSGTVTSSYDATGDFSGSVGANTLKGQAVTGVFSYDTELAPSDSSSTDPLVGAYVTAAPTSGAWLSMSITVGGFEMDLSSTDEFRAIYVQPSSNSDYFTVESGTLDEEPDDDPTTDSYYYRFAYAYIGEFVDNLFDDDSLPTMLEWVDTDVSDDTERSSLGYFTIKDFVNRFAEGYDYDYDANGFFNVAAMSLAIRTGDVAEPGVVILIAAGLLSIGYQRRKQIKTG